MTLHVPSIHTPAALHVPGWLQALVLIAIVVVFFAILASLNVIQPAKTSEDLYQEFRAEERSLVLDTTLQQRAYDAYRQGERNPVYLDTGSMQRAWQDYRAGERDLK